MKPVKTAQSLLSHLFSDNIERKLLDGGFTKYFSLADCNYMIITYGEKASNLLGNGQL
jgi:hypothetical protein